MAISENKALIRRYYDVMWNSWDLGKADEIIDPAIVFRGSLAINVRGLGEFKEYMALVRAAFPDFQNTIEELIAEGETVVARLMHRGTHRGELLGIPPTGNRVAYAGVAIFRIASGRIAEGWVLGDTLGLMRQLGAKP